MDKDCYINGFKSFRSVATFLNTHAYIFIDIFIY